MNSTVNESKYSSPLNSSANKIGESIFYCLILVASLAGNSFLIIIVYKMQTMRKPINYFIVNMATSDLLFAVFLLPILLKELFLDSWPVSGRLGLALCKLSYFLADISSVVSVESLVLIAVDRFVAVVYPLRSPLMRSKLCPFFIFITWIVAMAFISPGLIALKLVKYSGKLACEPRWNEAFGESWSVKYYLLAHVVLIYCIPIASLAILYSIILIKLKSQKKPGEQSVNAEEQRARRNRNVLKMAIAIVFGFALCFLPWSIIFLLDYFPSGVELPSYSVKVVLFLARTNCAINPCICFTFSGNYRQGLKKILKCSGF